MDGNRQFDNNESFNNFSGNNFQNNDFVDDIFYSPDTNVKKKKEKRSFGFGTLILCVVIAALVGAGGAFGAFIYGGNFISKITGNYNRDTSGNKTITNITVNEETDSVIAAAAQKATPCVVGIRTTFAVSNFFGGSSESSGEGSGVIYSSDGYIVTNYHVIESAVEASNSLIQVFMNGETEGTKATVVGYNITNDLAVIKINKTGLTAIEIAKSSELKTGQYVAVIGCPGGLDFMGSVTYGIISGLNRKTSSDSTYTTEFLQTDAAINPGNSGGAMVNTKGELVGVPSSKIVSESIEGMGFAIPSDTVVEICNKIISKQNSAKPYIGISISTRYDSTTLQMLGYPAGAVIQSVASKSPADKAGMKRGDIVTEFNGREITDYSAFNAAVNDVSPGDSVSIKLFRSGKYYSTNLTVGADS